MVLLIWIILLLDYFLCCYNYIRQCDFFWCLTLVIRIGWRKENKNLMKIADAKQLILSEYIYIYSYFSYFCRFSLIHPYTFWNNVCKKLARFSIPSRLKEQNRESTKGYSRWKVAPVANAPWKPLIIRWGSKSVSRSWNSWKVWLVGQGSECHLTFVRGKLHIAE